MLSVDFFCQSHVFNFCVVAFVPRVIQIWENFFYLQAFFSFPTFGACTISTCFYQGFLGAGSSFQTAGFPTVVRNTDPTLVCLNHTFSKRYYQVGSICVLGSAVEHYINLSPVLNLHFNGLICWKLSFQLAT